jgi:hypothetical protein
MIHDIDHPGLNNNFLVTTAAPYALLYNDKSVLENHHLTTGFKLLCEVPDCDWLIGTGTLSKPDWKAFRELVIEMVLATDLSQHLALVSKFRNKLTRGKYVPSDKDNAFKPAEHKEDRILLLQMILKCGDVSNPSKTWDIYSVWIERILMEWFYQGDFERQIGLPISPYMDRETCNVPSSQIGFIKFICSPLFETFHRFADIQVVMDGLKQNWEYWECMEEKNKNQQQAAKETSAALGSPNGEVATAGGLGLGNPSIMSLLGSGPAITGQANQAAGQQMTETDAISNGSGYKQARKFSLVFQGQLKHSSAASSAQGSLSGSQASIQSYNSAPPVPSLPANTEIYTSKSVQLYSQAGLNGAPIASSNAVPLGIGANSPVPLSIAIDIPQTSSAPTAPGPALSQSPSYPPALQMTPTAVANPLTTSTAVTIASQAPLSSIQERSENDLTGIMRSASASTVLSSPSLADASSSSNQYPRRASTNTVPVQKNSNTSI